MSPDLLAALLADPGRAAELSPAEAAATIVKLAALQSTIAARLAAPASMRDAERHGATEDDMVGAEEAAKRTGMSKRWLYKHADALPFAHRTSPRSVRFSAHGIKRWLAERKS